MADPTDPSRNPKRDFAVGLTVLAGLLIAAVLILSFAGVKNLVRKGYAVTVLLPRAQGLAAGSTVYLAGIPIGTVADVKPVHNEDGTYGVRAVASIYDEYTLPATTSVELNEQILGGVARLIFFADKPVAKDAKETTLRKDGSAVISGYRNNLAIELANKIMGQGPDGNPLEGGVGGMMTDVGELVRSLKTATDRIGANFEPVDAGKLAKGEAQPNIHTLITRLNSLVAHTDEVVADPKMRADIAETLASAKKAAANIDASITSVRGTITSLGETLGKAVDSTSGEAKATLAQAKDTLAAMQDKYGKLADELNKTTTEVNTLLKAINEGEGTAGKLVHDPALYENLNDAAQRLDKAFEEMRLLVEKVKKEGVDLRMK